MAGLFDDFGLGTDAKTAELQAKLNADARRQAEVAANARGLTGVARAGSTIGTRFGSALAEGLFGAPEDEAIAAARKQGELVKSLQGLEGDPNSSAFALSAAQEALSHGRPDLALKFRTAASARAQAEESAVAQASAAAAKEGRAVAAARRDELTGLGTAARNEFLATNPQYLVDNLGLTPEQAQSVSDGVAEQNNLKRLKLRNDMEDITKATSTKVTGSDVAQIEAHLFNNGIDLSSFGFGSDEEDLKAFATPIASEVRRRMDVLKDGGVRGNEAAITTEVLQDLVQGGALQVSPQFFGGDQGELNIDGIDKTKVNEILSGTGKVDFDFSD